MTTPLDLMTMRAERPAAADRGRALRDRGSRDDAFPDALRSAVDANSRGRDRAEQARSSARDDRPASSDRARPTDRPERRGDGSRSERATERRRSGDGADTAAQAAVLTALRSNGLSADALQSVATLLAEPPAATDDLVQAGLDSGELAVATDETALPADLDGVATTADPAVLTGAEAASASVGGNVATALAGDVQANATGVAVDEVTDDATSHTGPARPSGQGHAASSAGARGLDRMAEVPADAARGTDPGALAEDGAATSPQRLTAPLVRAAERAMGGQPTAITETTDTARPPVSALSGEPAPIQGLALGRIPTDRGATPGAASVQRVLDALELLEQAPPPRQITLELGDARVRVALDDGQVRLSVVGPGNDAVEKWLEETRAALAQHGFDLGQQAGERTEEQTDGEQPTAGTPVDGATATTASRDDSGALRL